MIERLHLSVILLLAAACWGGLLILDGVAVSISWLRPLTIVVGILLVLLAGFDLVLWRVSLLQGWFVKRPVIHGTWRATIRSNWIDPETGDRVGPIAGYMAIRQTFSSLSLRRMTE